MQTDVSSSERRAAATTAPRACVNCGAPQIGAWCPHCGQRQLTGRHTLRGLLRSIADRVFNMEGGLTRTVIDLTIRPGRMIREYLGGRTVPYMHPVAYLLVATGAFALSAQLVGGTANTPEGDGIFFLLVIPFVALASRVVFLRGRYNYAEHLIGIMYLIAHALLGLAVLYLATRYISGPFLGWYVAASLAAAGIYCLWGFSGLFPDRRIVAALAGVVALVVGAIGWLVALAWVVSWLRR